jgi:hypothetical protein
MRWVTRPLSTDSGRVDDQDRQAVQSSAALAWDNKKYVSDSNSRISGLESSLLC